MKIIVAVALISLTLTGCGGVNKYFKGSLLVFEANQSDEYKSEAVQACKMKSRSTSELRSCLEIRERG